MKIATYLLVFAIAFAEGQQFQQLRELYLRFYCGNPSSNFIRNLCQRIASTTPAPQTLPRRPPTNPPTRRPTSPPTPSSRPTQSRQNSDRICTRASRRCTEGKLLGDLFAVNFLAPAPGGPVAPASGRGGNGVFPTGGRTTTSGRTFGTSTGGNGRPSGGQTTTFFGGRTIATNNNNNNFLRPQPGQFGSSTGGGSRPNPSTGGGSQPGRGGGRTLTIDPPCTSRFITDSRGRVIAGSCIRANQTNTTQVQASRFRRQIFNPYESKRDLLIMMDESGSVGSERFDKVKRIAAAIVRLLCQNIRVHPDYTRVAVASFDSQFHFHIQLTSPYQYRYLDSDGDALANFIYSRIRYNSRSAGKTCLIDALEQAYSRALGRQYGGRRGQPYVEQDIIIISDGCENCVKPDYYAHDRIRQITSFFISENIHVYVIGIGIRERCKETLNLLAQGGRCFHFFYLTNWDYIVDDFLYELEYPPAGICLNTFETAEGQCLSNFG